MKRTVCAWLLALGLAVGTALPASAAAFSDVASNAWYAQAVGEVSDAGIMNGKGSGTFSPADSVTVKEMVAVLARLAGQQPQQSVTGSSAEQLSVFLYRYSQYAGQELASGVLDLYNDVDSVQSWAREGMAHAVGAGLITGTDEGNLEPAGPATRAQLAVILQRLMIPAVG